MNNLRQALVYFAKEFIGWIFFCLGGVFYVKYLFRKKPYLIVLNYHSFSKYNNFRIKRGSVLETGYSNNFYKQIKWLSKHFRFLYPEEFQADNSNLGLNILITFDDGYQDNFDIAVPILLKENAKAIFFIVSNLPGSGEILLHDKMRILVEKGIISVTKAEHILSALNQGKQIDPQFIENIEKDFGQLAIKKILMDWPDITEIANQGLKIGSHTQSHTPLSFLTYEHALFELNGSFSRLEEKLGSMQTKHFAYPNGLYNNNSHQAVKDSGVHYAYTTQSGVNTINVDPLKIKRIGINASDSLGVILLKFFMARRNVS